MVFFTIHIIFFQDLLLYLLQLVQALKYENFDDITEAHDKMQLNTASSSEINAESKESISTEKLTR